MIQLEGAAIVLRGCAPIRHGLEAAEVAAGALFAGRVNGHVPDFGGTAFEAVVDSAVKHQASADANVENTDQKQAARTGGIPKPILSEGRSGRLLLKGDWERERIADDFFNADVVPAFKVRRVDHHAALVVIRAGGDKPNAEDLIPTYPRIVDATVGEVDHLV
ncbi:hypothetical protein SDC9_150142 [bioreactor metagenome]|uniref:Uncharacterized protein n=1 Tax=bioreactor metagenome TaxID=1076179 RepID=A0A645ELP1_9ZZZZ